MYFITQLARNSSETGGRLVTLGYISITEVILLDLRLRCFEAPGLSIPHLA